MFKNLTRLHQDMLIMIVLALVTFSIYFYSLCPTVYLIDSGELATVSYTLGVAHPTGYPLYTLISYFFAHIPGEPIKNLNILSAIFSVVAAIFFYLAAKKILKTRLLSIISASLFAFSPTIWRTSITNEVYPLTALCAVLVIYLLYNLRDNRSLYILMYLIGLSFTNHIIIFAVVLPVFLYIVLGYRLSSRMILIALLFILLSLSLYLYLMARTLGGAEIAWGNTDNFQKLLWHITGKQYQVWMFSLTFKGIMGNLLNGFKILLRDFLYVFIVPVFLGFYHLFKSEHRKFWLFLSIFLLNLIYIINYSIPDIESYYIPGLVALIFVFTYGLKMLFRYLRWFIIVPVAILIPIINYHSCTLRDNTFGLDYSNGHCAQLPRSALLICNYWDIYAPTMYLKEVKGSMQDLIIIDKELLRRTWYIKYLEETYPQLYEDVSKEVEEYLVELFKFEYNKPYNKRTIQTKYIKLLESFVDAQIDQGVYFAMPFFDADLNAVKPTYHRIPSGLVFKIQKDTSYYEFDFSKLILKRPRIINDERLKINIEIVKKMVYNNIAYLNSTKRFDEFSKAKAWVENFSGLK